MVLGVATSSLVVQNALRIYLERNVQGPDKEDVSSRSLPSPVYRKLGTKN